MRVAEQRAEQERTSDGDKKVVGRIVGGIDEDFFLGAIKTTTRSAREHQSRNLIMWTRSSQ